MKRFKKHENTMIPCYCPFHSRFNDINNMLGGSSFINYFEANCDTGTGVFYTQRALLQHFAIMDDFYHNMLICYLTYLHDHNMTLVGDSEQKMEEKGILEDLNKIDEDVYKRHQRESKHR